mmetsp:Transcript_29804/g.60504  ORF Transcript_29804/g.60504 Transcript_29804/m.60504 type:complete len:231 (+) Transcript_29804:1192-1884(+)
MGRHSHAFGHIIIRLLADTTMKKVVLIRHGESLGQIARKNGISRRDPSLTDCFLSPKGIQQATELKGNAILNRYQFDLICSSPLTRALATCCLAFGHLAEERNKDDACSTTTFVVNSDICEIGGRIPENQGRPLNKVLRAIRKELGWCISQHCLDRFDFTSLPVSWPFHPKGRDGKENFIQWLRGRDETTIGVVCHYNTIRWLLQNAVDDVPNCHPIECILTDAGKLILC